MESVTSNFRCNTDRLVCQSDCPPCVATASAVTLALTRVAPVDSVPQDAARIVEFLNSVTLLIKAALHCYHHAASLSSNAMDPCGTNSEPTADDLCISTIYGIASELDKQCVTAMSKVYALDSSVSALRPNHGPATETWTEPTSLAPTQTRVSLEVETGSLPAWIVQFVVLMNYVISFITSGDNSSSAFLLTFVARGGMSCIAEFSSALCRLARDPRTSTVTAEQIQDVLSGCCKCYKFMMSVASTLSSSASQPTLQLISDVWPYACDGLSKAQKSALAVIAFAVSKHGSAVMNNMTASAESLESVVRHVVAYVECCQSRTVNESVACDASAAESACQVLTACITVQTSLSATVIPREVLTHLCTFGWKWALSSPSPSLVDSISLMAAIPLRPVVSKICSHIFDDVLHMENSSAWIKLVVRLMETNASYICDVFMDDISAAAAAAAADDHSDSSQLATRLLQYATICSLCGRYENSDEIETALGFGMGLLFDDVWKTVPASCQDLNFQRHYLHNLFLSRQVMSKTAVSAAAFSEVLLCSLAPTDVGCAAALSLALLLCRHEEDADNGSFKLEHMTLPDSYPGDLIRSLEMLPHPDSNGRSLQVSLLFRIGMVLNWNACGESQWNHRVITYYARALALDCPLQHVLLQTISELVLSPPDITPTYLSSALIFRTQHLASDLLVPFGQSLLSQICFCLKSGFVSVVLLHSLLINLLKAMNDDSRNDPLLTRALVLTLSAASLAAPSVISAETSDFTALCCSAQRHVLHSLAAADAQGAFDIETFQSIQLLCRLKVCDALLAEGLLPYFLRSFDTGINIDAVQCIIMSLSHAFAPEFSGDSWSRCVPIVSRILMQSDFSELLVLHNNVIILAELIIHSLCIENWLHRKIMYRIALVLDSALRCQSAILLRDFYDAFLLCVPTLDNSDWCEEFVVVSARCCAFDCRTILDSAAIRFSACRVIFAISQLNSPVVAASVVVCSLIEAVESCLASSECIVLLVRSLILVASVSPLLLVELFPSTILRISLEAIDRLSADAVHCVIQRKLLSAPS